MDLRSFLSHYKNYLNTYLFAGIFLGVVVGLVLPNQIRDFEIVGELFLRSLKLLIVPIVLLSVLSGIVNLGDSGTLGRLGLKTLGYYTATTALAVFVGLSLVNIFSPGLGAGSAALSVSGSPVQQSVQGGLAEVILNIIPPNIFQAAVEGNVLGLIFFSVFLGVAILRTDQSSTRAARDVINSLFGALIWMVDTIMLSAPLGITVLVGVLVSEMRESQAFTALGQEMALYAVTVISGLIVHACIVLPAILAFFRVSPISFFKAMSPAVTTAFSTASSSATLPVTLDALEHRARIPNKYASFVAPLGSTVNMDGTAIYESVAAVFIANIYGMELTFFDQFTIFLTATFSAIGAAGIPGAGLIMMTVVLQSVGIPVEGIALIVALDRPLDMLRTAVNVWGDSIGAAVIAASEGDS